MNYHESHCCLSLLLLPASGATLVCRMLRQAGSASAALRLPDQRVISLGMREAALHAFHQLRGNPDPALTPMVDELQAHDVSVIAAHETSYPPRLLEIACPPAVLFVKGSVAALALPQIAMVGSRRPTPGGRKSAAVLARALAKYGLTVTSGLAIGIDTECHAGAIQTGTSVAVMATGPDRIYPASNRGLAAEIVERGGALVTEFVPGTRPEAANFPRRNRIISGLSLGVVVVEAALPSGSLLTAQYAAEQNREVMAMPGSVHSALSRGCHMLLRHGAALVEDADDVLIALGDRFMPRPQPTPRQQESSQRSSSLDVDALGAERLQLLQWVGYEATTLDAIVAMSGMDAATVAAALTLLELHGLVECCPGGYTRSP